MSHQPPQKQKPPFSETDSSFLSFSPPISIEKGFTEGRDWLDNSRNSFDRQTRKKRSLPTLFKGCDFSKEGSPVSFFPFLAAYSSYRWGFSGSSAWMLRLKLRTACRMASSMVAASGVRRVEQLLPSASSMQTFTPEVFFSGCSDSFLLSRLTWPFISIYLRIVQPNLLPALNKLQTLIPHGQHAWRSKQKRRPCGGVFNVQVKWFKVVKVGKKKEGKALATICNE